MERKLTAEELELPIGLTQLREMLVFYGVSSAWIYGSYARGEQQSGSDLNMLVHMADSHAGWEFLGLAVALQDATPIEVNVSTMLNRHFVRYIEPELIAIL